LSDFFAIEISGPDGVVIQAQIEEHLGQMRSDWLPDTMRALGLAFKRVTMANQFASEGGTLGGGWIPNSPGYAGWKQATFGGDLIGSAPGLCAAP